MPRHPERLVLAASRLKLFVILVVLLAAMTLGLWVIGMADDGEMVIWSWIGVGALGLGVLAALF